MNYDTIICELADNVLTVTLNRPDRMNGFNQQMCDEFVDLWNMARNTDEVHVVVLRAAGERAFCTGVDVIDGYELPDNVFSAADPGMSLSPKLNQVWKPVVCAVHGMAAGGAFYWINESDIVICSDDATFFDPHLTYGLTSALEPIGMTRRIPLGEVLRIALLGLEERVSAERALQIGLVTEVVPRAQLWDRAAELAASIAAKEPAAVQGTVKAIWQSLDMTRTQALQVGLSYIQLGRYMGPWPPDRAGATRPQWKLR